MRREDVIFLSQLVESLEEAEEKLRQAYAAKDAEKFNKSKKFMSQIQKKISGVIR